MISLIVAMDEQGLIGRDNQLPWHLPADLRYFKQTTMGRPVVMGRKTFESIGKPLPGRRNVIVTRNRSYAAAGCEIIHSLADMPGGGEDEVFVIGGAELFAAMLPLADRLYLTRIRETFAGDTYFPELNEADWRLVSTAEGVVDDKNPHPHAFLVYERQA